MSKFIVTNKEYLTVMIDQPLIPNGIFRPIAAWSGSLECKRGDYTLNQIASLAGRAEYVFKVGKFTQHGEFVNLTDAVLDYLEERS